MKILLVLGIIVLDLFVAGAILLRFDGKGLGESPDPRHTRTSTSRRSPTGPTKDRTRSLPVAATVRVTVVGHVITAIVIVEHVNGQGVGGSGHRFRHRRELARGRRRRRRHLLLEGDPASDQRRARRTGRPVD
ncbi:MAG: hypothetical protein MZW92_12425 [Comamonadaceae bacterium]|nr:hypothetical protein [Comamonadaceae bacterium]